MSVKTTSTTTKRPIRSLTAHEKLEAIRRVHEGESKASVARDIGVPESTLRGWCKNEDKISYLSRQSSPESNDDIEPKEKRTKVEEQPYNLSMKTRYQDVTKSEMEAAKTIADLSMKMEPQKPSNQSELMKLSVEFGLNRPEFFTPSNTTSNDVVNTLFLQWNNLVMQQQQLLQQKTTPLKKDMSCGIITNSTEPKPPPTLPKREKTHSMEDPISHWLKAQQAMMMASQIPTTTTTTTTPTVTEHDNSSWFWKWYKQVASGQTTADKPILYQHLTRSRDVENIEQRANKSTAKTRAVLDNLLFNNNNNVPTGRKEELSEVEEALVHGEKFLKWLETCSEPSVSTVQIMQFKTLLNNVRSGVERKNGDVQNLKAKVKRK